MDRFGIAVRRGGFGLILHAIVMAFLGLANAGAAFSQAAEKPAGSDARLGLELNDLLQKGPDCRLSIVLHNGIGTDIADLALELVVFADDRRVDRILVVKGGHLPAGATRVRQFDLKDRDCATIGRLLVNDVTRCEGEGLAPATCLGALATTSRAGTPFGS